VVHSTKTVTASTPQVHCTNFSWQQDAQAAYVANLSDPWALDGAAGPHNGDGLACTQLPVDPARARSVATDAYVAPALASKSSLVNPQLDYFGIAEDGLPGDTGILDDIDTNAGKAPSAIEYFNYWSSDFDPTPVRQSWARGALPIMTWMSVAADSTSPTASSFTLANIVSGQFDAYLLRYAGAILQNGQPLGIRFDHEMNGNWYPWSAGLNANQGTNGAPNLYVQAWRHVWSVFNSVGANSNVIWLWSPVRVDTLTPHSNVSGLKYETNLAEDYPGDQYVDWMGMTAYEYKTTENWTFAGTFQQTLTGLHSVSSKPIFISETGASQVVGTTDMTALKAQWTVQALAGFANDRSIVGFVWFNNIVTDVHKADGVPFQTNWQFTTSPQAQAAFKAGVADSRFASGLMPDGLGAS
jgi:mannan endo-1,4-beta-mannosidase